MSSPRSPLTILRLADGEDGPALAAAIAAFEPARAQTIKDDDKTAVYRASVAGRDLIVKCWRNAGLLSRLRARLGLTQAHRHWRGSELLAKHGIPAARPLALLRARDSFEWLMMPALPGRSLLQHAADSTLPIRTQHRLAAAAGELVRRLDDAAIFNRDNKPSNIIVTSLEPGPALALIDTVGIRPGARRMGGMDFMLASLAIEPIGCGHRPRLPLMMRAALAAAAGDRDEARYLWRSATPIVEAQRGAAPRVNPLAPEKA